VPTRKENNELFIKLEGYENIPNLAIAISPLVLGWGPPIKTENDHPVFSAR
jgi:hypothetical protein